MIDADAILRAEEQFSAWKLEHLVAENMYIYPRLDDLLEHLRGVAKRQTYIALDSTFAEILIRAGEQKTPPAWFRADTEPAEAIGLLYNLEVIGIERLTKGDGASNRPWEGYDFVFSRPKGKPERSGSFMFHPGLWGALELA